MVLTLSHKNTERLKDKPKLHMHFGQTSANGIFGIVDLCLTEGIQFWKVSAPRTKRQALWLPT